MSHRKPDEERVRRNKPRYLQHVLAWDGKTRGPSLPEGYPWCEETKRWYEEFRNSPNAMLTEDSDWESILVGALIHNRLWSPPVLDDKSWKPLSPSEMTSLSAELRQRMKPYGYTNEDRLRLNVEIDDLEDSDTPRQEQQSSIDYEALLTLPVEN